MEKSIIIIFGLVVCIILITIITILGLKKYSVGAAGSSAQYPNPTKMFIPPSPFISTSPYENITPCISPALSNCCGCYGNTCASPDLNEVFLIDFGPSGISVLGMQQFMENNNIKIATDLQLKQYYKMGGGVFYAYPSFYDSNGNVLLPVGPMYNRLSVGGDFVSPLPIYTAPQQSGIIYMTETNNFGYAAVLRNIPYNNLSSGIFYAKLSNYQPQQVLYTPTQPQSPLVPTGFLPVRYVWAYGNKHKLLGSTSINLSTGLFNMSIGVSYAPIIIYPFLFTSIGCNQTPQIIPHTISPVRGILNPGLSSSTITQGQSCNPYFIPFCTTT